MSTKEVLNEEVLFKQGVFEKVRRWYKGWDLTLNGKFVNGWRGKETEVVETIIKPTKTFKVE